MSTRFPKYNLPFSIFLDERLALTPRDSAVEFRIFCKYDNSRPGCRIRQHKELMYAGHYVRLIAISACS